jgi:hypothetical protein
MKNTLLAAAGILMLAAAPDSARAAAGADEMAEIRQQLQALAQRLDRLEQENASLKSQNEQLAAQSDYLKAEARGLRKEAATAAVEIGKVKGTDWAGRVAFKGDLRYRHDDTHDETRAANGSLATADRARQRIRARVGLEAKATDDIRVGVQFTTSENGDPASGNQTLDGVFSRKALELDLAYFDWRFADWGHAIGGKLKMPFVRPGQSMFWDNDINPEGLALTFNRGPWFGTAYSFWIDEVSGSQSAVTADSMLTGLQVGGRMPVGASSLALAAHYYDLSAGRGRRGIFYNCSATSNSCANGNTVIGAPGAGVLAYDFRVLELLADFNTTLGALPVQLWADFAQNQAADDLDTAWAAGFVFGKTGERRSWEAGAFYEVLEKDSLFAQFIDSEWGGRSTDSRGWTLKAGYMPVKNWSIDLTYFINERNVDVGTPADYERLLLDFNVKF